MNTELTKVDPKQLDEVVKNSGLEITEGETIKQSYQPFLIRLAEIQANASKINFENPSEIDETIAKKLRLETVKVRTGSEELKDGRKKIHLLKGNLEQAAYNLIAASCKLTEEAFVQVEKGCELKEKARIAKLESDRAEQLRQYTEIMPMSLGLLQEDVFQAYLSAQKNAYEARIAAEKQAELDRIAAEKAEAAERERIRLENEALKQAAIEREKAIDAERIEAEKKLEAERAEAAKKQKAIEDAARIEREKADAERAKLVAELKAKADAEAKDKAEAERIEQKRITAANTAAKAPDKDKLKAFVNSITLPVLPELKSDESKATAAVITAKFEAFKNWANQQIESI